LSALEDLGLSGCGLDPSCLLPTAAGLTRLELLHVTLQPEQAQQDSELGASQLLQLLSRCTALRELNLSTKAADWSQQQLAQYSALTASSNLQKLRIQIDSIPSAAWAHVSAAGRKLPQLRSFCAADFSSCRSADITRLVSCCPALKNLSPQTAADASLSPLQSLSALAHLYVGPVSPAVIRSDLAALSQLQSLELRIAQPAAGPDGVAGSRLHWAPYVRLASKVSERHVLLSLTSVLSVHAALCEAMLVWAGCRPRRCWQHTAVLCCAADPLKSGGFFSSASTGTGSQLHVVSRLCVMSDRATECGNGWLCVAVALCLQAPAGAPPDVWAQLQEKCAAEQAAQQQSSGQQAAGA
jgi:hypothetical protein